MPDMPDNQSNTDNVIALPHVVAAYREDLDQSIKWQVEPSVGDHGVGVDFTNGIVTVPLTGGSHAALVRLQQMVYLRSAPTDDRVYGQVAKSYNDISEPLIRLADRGRLNAMTRKYAAKLPTPIIIEPDGSEKVKGKRLATANTPMAWDKCVEFAAENCGTKGFDQFISGVASVNKDWAKTLKHIKNRLEATYDESVDVLGSTEHQVHWGDNIFGPSGLGEAVIAASMLTQYMSNSYRAPKSIQESMSEKEDEAAANYGELPDPDDILRGYDKIEPSMQLDVTKLPADFEFDTDPDEDNRLEYFGKLIWNDKMPLTTQVKGFMARKRRASNMGRTLSYPTRLYTDPQYRAFGNKVRVRGGVVVLDISGSMHLSEADINEILEVAPAALIMAYSDCDNGNGEPNAHLLANRGWRVNKFVDVNRGGNGVDGTALTWALRHRKPGEEVIWVSDGNVFGVGGSRGTHLVVQCAQLVKKHRIIMIPSVDAAVAAFKSGRPMRQFNRPAGPIRDALLGRYS